MPDKKEEQPDQLSNILELLTNLRDNHLEHLSMDISELKLDVGDLKTRVASIEEIKDLLKDNFSKIVAALIAISAAATGANLLM